MQGAIGKPERTPGSILSVFHGRLPGIQTKLMLYFLVIVLLPLVTLGIVGPMLYANSIKRETNLHMVGMIGQVNLNIEYLVREAERSIDFLSATPAISSFLKATTPAPGTRLDAASILRAVLNSNPALAGILLVNESGAWLGPDYSQNARDPLTEELWYRSARDTAGSVRLVARPIGRNLRLNQAVAAEDIVSAVKAIVDPANGAILGVVLVDFRLAAIESVFRNASLGQGGFLFIADSGGEIVYAPINDIVYRVPLDRVIGDSSSAVLKLGSVEYQVIAKRSFYTGWRTVGVFSFREMLREVRLLRYWSLMIGGLTMLFAVVAAAFFTSSISRPVLALRGLMKQAEDGDLSVRFAERAGDEIGDLGHGLNEMLERIQTLIDQVYREQKSLRESELKILREQIKPHFLYNTLDTIQWMAREGRVDDVVCLVESLTTLFRIGLSRGKELIPLADELAHVTSYLCIQKMRYEDKFDFEFKVEDGLSNIPILRLSLQPLVENAIYHGIKERRGHGNLSIEAKKVEGELLLIVRDDGVGMDDATLAALTESLEQSTVSDGGYGARNVHERVRLTFGKPYGLSYSRVLSGGTEALLRMPFGEGEVT